MEWDICYKNYYILFLNVCLVFFLFLCFDLLVYFKFGNFIILSLDLE